MLPRLTRETAVKIMNEELKRSNFEKYLSEFMAENPTLAAMCIAAEVAGKLCTPVVAFLYHLLKAQGEIDELEMEFKS